MRQCNARSLDTNCPHVKGVARCSAPDGELPSDHHPEALVTPRHNRQERPVDMWTIGGADRLRFPRFPSKLEKRGNARLRPHTHRPRQQGELIIDDSKNHTRPAERTNGVHSNHLTPKAPYKPAPAKAGVEHRQGPATRALARQKDDLQPHGPA